MEEEVKIMDEREEKPLEKMTVKELKVIAMGVTANKVRS